jgi:hypothetical protein
MRRRPVFDDIALRDEFRHRLQPAGIVIPESKLNLRPSFRIELLRDPAAREAVQAALEWFALVLHALLAQAHLVATVDPLAAVVNTSGVISRERGATRDR